MDIIGANAVASVQPCSACNTFPARISAQQWVSFTWVYGSERWYSTAWWIVSGIDAQNAWSVNGLLGNR